MKNLKIVFLLVLLGGMFGLCSAEPVAAEKPVCDVHVFVHGTYGASLSFFNYSLVQRDELSSALLYVRMQNHLRNEERTKNRRLMMDEGMCEINLKSHLPPESPLDCVIKAFDEVHRASDPSCKNEQRYFVWGWSGLLSQRERRRDAIRFYNELALLEAKIIAEGKTPRISGYLHSHGANVGLNLGLVDLCAFEQKIVEQEKLDPSVDCMKNLLLDDGSDLVKIRGDLYTDEERLFFRRPTVRLKNPLTLFLFGMPVQEETEPLVCSPLFDMIVHNYSENDGVQMSDPVSSKAPSRVYFNPHLTKGREYIKTVRWMINRTPVDVCAACVKARGISPQRKITMTDLLRNRSWMRRARNGGGNPLSHHPEDPTHADFWGIFKPHRGMFYEGVPLVVFSPLLKTLLQDVGDAQHCDFCVVQKKDNCADVSLYSYEQSRSEAPKLSAHSHFTLTPILTARQNEGKFFKNIRNVAVRQNERKFFENVRSAAARFFRKA